MSNPNTTTPTPAQSARKHPRHALSVRGGYLLVSGDGYNAYTDYRAPKGWAKLFHEAKALLATPGAAQ